MSSSYRYIRKFGSLVFSPTFKLIAVILKITEEILPLKATVRQISVWFK